MTGEFPDPLEDKLRTDLLHLDLCGTLLNVGGEGEIELEELLERVRYATLIHLGQCARHRVGIRAPEADDS